MLTSVHLSPSFPAEPNAEGVVPTPFLHVAVPRPEDAPEEHEGLSKVERGRLTTQYSLKSWEYLGSTGER